jgi:hypothetical protein
LTVPFKLSVMLDPCTHVALAKAELDQKDFLGGALEILVVLGVSEEVVWHAVVGLMCDRSRQGKSQDGRRPLHPIQLHHDSLCGGECASGMRQWVSNNTKSQTSQWYTFSIEQGATSPRKPSSSEEVGGGVSRTWTTRATALVHTHQECFAVVLVSVWLCVRTHERIAGMFVSRNPNFINEETRRLWYL